MPTFEGQISEDEMVALVAYVKALGTGAANPPAPVANPDKSPYPVTPNNEPSMAVPNRQAAPNQSKPNGK